MRSERNGQQITQFTGEIQVASRIIDALSSGLYETPAACLKELINNSFDADATVTKLHVRPEADQIIIEDDGAGLTRGEFERHFRRISESHKRDNSDSSPSGRRPQIGKIGIGLIAANELCETMEIYSTTAGSDELLRVQINFAEMRQDPVLRRQEDGSITKADFEGQVSTGEVTKEDHYTQIFLTNVHGEARNILVGAQQPGNPSRGLSLYGLAPNSIQKKLEHGALKSWSDLDPYSETMLRVGLNVPVKYHDSWLPEDLQPEVSDLEREVAELGFTVYYDGPELRKPIVLRPLAVRTILRRFHHDGALVGAKGYFFVQHGVVRPNNLNGVLIRIRNAAVGEYDRTFMEFPTSVGTLFQRWISAEVWAGDGLEEAMNIDRKTLRVTHPAYVELQSAVHKALAEVIKDARSSLHDEGVAERTVEKRRTEAERIRDTVEDPRLQLSESSRERIAQAWRLPRSENSKDRALLRTFTVSQLYFTVLEAAAEVLPPKELERFVEVLTDKMKASGRRRRDQLMKRWTRSDPRSMW
jgi:Histidine kinase-, DNA gyrase B-, and HSP90-like ATPase